MAESITDRATSYVENVRRYTLGSYYFNDERMHELAKNGIECRLKLAEAMRTIEDLVAEINALKNKIEETK